MTAHPTSKPAGLLLTLGSALYDALLVTAILFIASTVVVIGNDGQSIAPGNVWFQLYLLAAGFPYFAWCWTLKGQTLGMKTWRITIQRVDGKPVRMRDAALRYFGALLSFAALALGYLWMLADARQRSWHDRLSGTQLVRIARNN